MTATATPTPSARKVVLDRDRETPAGATGQVLQIPLELIDVGENVRKSVEDLDELAGSIAEEGVLQPISVRDMAGDRYAINFGQSRYLACKQLGLATIPAIVDNTERTPAELAILQLLENMARKDPRPLDTARGMKLVVDAGITQAELAKRIGKAATTVTNYLALLDAPAKVRDAVEQGLISPSHAKAIKGMPVSDQEELLEEALEEHLSAHELEEAVQEHKANAEYRAARQAENAEAAKAVLDREQGKIDELVRKIPLSTPIRVSGYWGQDDKANAAAERLRAMGFTKVALKRAESRPKGYCDCTAWKVEVRYDSALSINPACIVAAHVQAKYSAERKRDAAKSDLQANVRKHVAAKSDLQANVRKHVAATSMAYASAVAPGRILVDRILAESVLWSRLNYRLPDWSVQHGGKRNTAWAVIRALSDEDLAKELTKELAADFTDKAGYHIDWSKLAEELGLDEEGKPRPEKPERPVKAPETPAFGQLVVNDDTRYRISKVVPGSLTLHLAADGRQWRNNPVIARTKAEHLTWDAEAQAWSGAITLTHG